MQIFLETERLILRRITADDVDALVALDNDPAVMRFLGPNCRTADEVRDTLLPSYLALYERHAGLGYWAAVERATEAFLGWFLLRPPTADAVPGDVELGYRLCTAAWGRGIATEGASALVAKGFAEFGVERVIARAMAVNAGSRRVMEKVGLRYVRTFHEQWPDPLPGTELGEVEYAVTRAEWDRQPAADHGPEVAR